MTKNEFIKGLNDLIGRPPFGAGGHERINREQMGPLDPQAPCRLALLRPTSLAGQICA